MDEMYLIECKKATLKMEQEELNKINEDMSKKLEIIFRLENELEEAGVEFDHTFTPIDWNEFDMGEALN